MNDLNDWDFKLPKKSKLIGQDLKCDLCGMLVHSKDNFVVNHWCYDGRVRSCYKCRSLNPIDRITEWWWTDVDDYEN